MRPPMRACDDDEGKPKYHVVRFHTMAPTTAAKMRTTSPSVSTRLGLLDGDRLDGVGDVLEGVRGRLELFRDLLQLEHGERIEVAAEQPGDESAVQLVGLVLDPVDLDPVVAEVLQ